MIVTFSNIYCWTLFKITLVFGVTLDTPKYKPIRENFICTISQNYTLALSNVFNILNNKCYRDCNDTHASSCTHNTYKIKNFVWFSLDHSWVTPCKWNLVFSDLAHKILLYGQTNGSPSNSRHFVWVRKNGVKAPSYWLCHLTPPCLFVLQVLLKLEFPMGIMQCMYM